ncbi:MAG: MFS transporter [Pseudomonadota bacterium]
MSRSSLLWTIFILTASQGLIGQFTVHGVPLFLRAEGHAASVISLVFIAGIPYTLRFLWAPLIDRYGGGSRGPYGTWIVAGQGVAFVALLGLVFADPAGSVALIVAALFVGMIAVGTQQAATSAMMIRHLAGPYHARGASMQAAGSTSAGLILGLLVLYLLADLGWQTVTLSIAALAAGLLAFVLLAVPLDRGHRTEPARISVRDYIAIFKVAEARKLFILTLITSVGMVIPYSLKSILLIDAGFSISQGGLIGIVLGNLVGLIAALAVRPLVDRFGGWRILIAIGLVAGATALAAAFLYWRGEHIDRVAIALVLITNGLVFASYTANRAILMPLCDQGRLATDFTSFASFEAFAILVVAALGSVALDNIGIVPLLVAGAGLSAAGAALIAASLARRPRELQTS